MKPEFAGLLLLLLTACGAAPQSGTSSELELTDVMSDQASASDLSGTYELTAVECYDSNNELSSMSEIVASPAHDTLMINGTTIIEQVSTSDCSAALNGVVDFDFINGVAQVNQVTVSSLKGANTCAAEFSVRNQSGAALTSPVNAELVAGVKNDFSSEFIASAADGLIGFATSLHAASDQSDSCFLVYQKANQ